MNALPDHNQHSDRTDSPEKKKGWLSKALKVIAVLSVLGLLVCLLLPTVRTARPAAYRNQCMNNLKQIVIGLRNYEEIYHAFPPAYTTDADGKPLHSWRTLILPFIEEKQLYDSIDLSKAWDAPANVEASKTSVYTYQCPSAPDRDNRTSYLAVLTPNSCFRATEPRKLSDITDGPRTTLMLIEVDSDHAVPWMSPVDADENIVMRLGPNSKLNHAGGMQAAFVDGHVSFLNEDTSAGQRRALISIAGDDNSVLEGTE